MSLYASPTSEDKRRIGTVCLSLVDEICLSGVVNGQQIQSNFPVLLFKHFVTEIMPQHRRSLISSGEQGSVWLKFSKRPFEFPFHLVHPNLIRREETSSGPDTKQVREKLSACNVAAELY